MSTRTDTLCPYAPLFGSQQLGKVDCPREHVGNVLSSQLHLDHTGGLFAFLSRRYQLLSPGVVTVYGPPGTRATVEGLLAAMESATTAASNIRARAGKPPAESVRRSEEHTSELQSLMRNS